MGGPVNGVPWSAMSSLVGAGGIVSAARRGDNDPNNPTNCTGIIVPTMLQIAQDALNYWLNLTVLYDRYWTAEEEKVTLPVCLFHVKKITQIRQTEVSKKRVILYEAQDNDATAKDKADSIRPNVMQTIVDNSVRQPTTYNMEIIVPFQPIGRYITEGQKTISDMVVAFSDLLGGGTPGGFTDWWEGIFSSVFAAVKNVNTVSQIMGKLSNMDGKNYINMNSLEAMADSSRVLCMKMWTGYDYKFVMITGMTYEKNPVEDDVFRASLTLQEMPVLSITEPKNKTPHLINRGWAVGATSVAQSAAIAPLLDFTGVTTAAGGGTTGLSLIGKALGGEV